MSAPYNDNNSKPFDSPGMSLRKICHWVKQIATNTSGGGGGGGDASAANQITQISQLSSILGAHGSVFVRSEGGSTPSEQGNFIAIIGHEEFGIESITLTGTSEGDSAIATGTSYPAGTQIIVPFTEITLSDFSGLVQLVKAPSA